MQILGCSGEFVFGGNGELSCSGDFLTMTPHELAVSANGLSSSDFSVIAGYFVLWFALAFGVKMIRRVFNV